MHRLLTKSAPPAEGSLHADSYKIVDAVAALCNSHKHQGRNIREVAKICLRPIAITPTWPQAQLHDGYPFAYQDLPHNLSYLLMDFMLTFSCAMYPPPCSFLVTPSSWGCATPEQEK